MSSLTGNVVSTGVISGKRLTLSNLAAPWAHWGLRFKPSMRVGTVRVTRSQLLGLVDELLRHIPKGYDLTPIKEALELAQKDTVIEVGLPENRASMTTDVKELKEVPEEGGLWITFTAGPIKKPHEEPETPTNDDSGS